MINQVLHHLPDDPSRGWPLTRKVMGEFARVLRPGGTLVVNFCSREQLRRGWWFSSLIEAAKERMIQRHALLAELESMIVSSGFDLCGRFVPTDAVIQGQSYYDPRGPLDAVWRAGDSVWATLSPQELEEVEKRVREMDAGGELENFVAEHDSDRLNVGQTTFLCARRR
jgi:SAM-dependent methyltransferase